MKRISYTVTYQGDTLVEVEVIYVYARNINSGYSKVLSIALKHVAPGEEIARIEFKEVH